MAVVLFTIDCPKCKVLEKKLEQSGIGYAVCRDKELMIEQGFDYLPVLKVDDKKLGFKEALEWIERGKA